MAHLGRAINQIGSYMEADVSEKEVFVKEPLEAYDKAIKSIVAAHSIQREKRSKYLRLVTDLAQKEAAHDKEPGDAKYAKVVQSRNEVDMAKADYEEVSARLLADFERLKRERKADMIRIMTAFVNLQVGLTSKVGHCVDELDGNMAVLESWNIPAAFPTGSYRQLTHDSGAF